MPTQRAKNGPLLAVVAEFIPHGTFKKWDDAGDLGEDAVGRVVGLRDAHAVHDVHDDLAVGLRAGERRDDFVHALHAAFATGEGAALFFDILIPFLPMKVDRRLVTKLSGSVKQISSHWMLVDDDLPPDFPLVVLSRYDRAAFIAKWASRSAVDDRLAEAMQDLKIAKGRFAKAKKALFLRMRAFRVMMVGLWKHSDFFAATPLLPGAGAGDDLFFGTARSMAIVWRWIAEVDPLPPGQFATLNDGYSAVDFTAELAALRALREVEREALMDMRIARAGVRNFQEEMVELVMAYRHSARGRLGTRSPLLALIPRTWRARLEE